MADVPAKLNYNESIRRIPEKVNEILDYLKRTRIQVDPRTMRKNETPAGITLSAQRQTVATPSQQLTDGYNGYFKITDASEHDESGKITQTRVAIIDGGLGSSNMPCRVNNSVFYVPSKNDMEVSGNETVILLKFDADTKTFSYEAKDSLPSDTQNIVYYQIGRVKVKDNRLVIQQDHTTGVIQLWWFRICQEEEIQ